MAGARRPLPRVSETEFQGSVLDLAELCGWLACHFHDSRREVRRRDGTRLFIGDAATSGFPDLVLVRPPDVLFVELKSEKGRITANQRKWRGALSQCPGVGYYLWKPGDWGEIEEVLR